MVRRLAGERGAEIAETALVLPLLFLFVMAIFWFGQAFRIYGTITQAARQGARAAITPTCTTCPASVVSSTQSAINAVNSALAAANLSSTQVQAPSPVPTFASCAGAGSVACDSSVAGNNICVQANVQLSTTTGNSPGTCGTSVSFGYKYPYHFAIPYTSWDLGNMTLPAQAQMRLETQ